MRPARSFRVGSLEVHGNVSPRGMMASLSPMSIGLWKTESGLTQNPRRHFEARQSKAGGPHLFR